MFELPLSMFPLNVDTKYSVLLKILQFSWNLELKFSKVPIVSAGSKSHLAHFGVSKTSQIWRYFLHNMTKKYMRSINELKASQK